MRVRRLNGDNLSYWIDRLERITPEAKPLWGKMSTAEVLKHLSYFNEVSLGEVEVADKSNWFSRTILRWIVFHWMPRWPKGIPAPDQYFPEPEGDVMVEKERLRKTVRRFVEKVERNPDMETVSEFLGPRPLSYWAHMHGKHMDHHFRQLGV